MRNLGKFITLLTVVIAMTSVPFPTPLGASASAKSAAPFLYYYSYTDNAFIVERADGTDRHMLGQDVTPQGDIVLGPGWSPSGKWLAWRTARTISADHYNGASYAGVVSVDGKQRLTYLEGYPDAELAWSPNKDFLMFAWQRLYYVPDKPYIMRLYLALVDPNIGILNAVEQTIQIDNVRSGYSYSSVPTIYWTQDNHAIVQLYNFQEIEDVEHNPYPSIYYIFNQDGSYTERTINNVAYGGHQITSSNGDVLISVDSKLTSQNVIDGTQHEIMPAIGVQSTDFQLVEYEQFEDIAWSPNKSVGIYYSTNLWLLDLTTHSSTLLITLPQNSALTESIAWSPDSHYAFVSMLGEVYLIDTIARTLEYFEVLLPNTVVQPLKVTWLSNTRASIACDELSCPQYTYIWEAGKTDLTSYHFPQRSMHDYSQSTSPDGKYISYFANSGALALFNTHTSTSFLIGPTGTLEPDQLRAGYVTWHTDSEWLIYADDIGDFNSSRHYGVGVTKADGSGFRDLTRLDLKGLGMANWLPSRVNPSDAPSIPDLFPPETVRHTGGISFVEWLPPTQFYSLSNLRIYTQQVQSNYLSYVAPDAQTKLKTQRVGLDVGYKAIMTENTIEITKLDTGQLVAKLKWAYSYMLYGMDAYYSPQMAFNHDGTLFMAYSNSISIWETKTWTKLVDLPVPSYYAAFSLDDRRIALVTGWYVKVWRVEDLITHYPPRPRRSYFF